MPRDRVPRRHDEANDGRQRRRDVQHHPSLRDPDAQARPRRLHHHDRLNERVHCQPRPLLYCIVSRAPPEDAYFI